jgi:tetratricopeptide (TPR) repeat protein
VDIEPGNANAHRNLATALFDERDIDGATSQAEQALRLNPDDSTTHDLLGRALASQGKLDDAVAEFERALEIDPAYAEAREDLQRIRRVRGVSRLVKPGRYDHLPGPTSSTA